MTAVDVLSGAVIPLAVDSNKFALPAVTRSTATVLITVLGKLTVRVRAHLRPIVHELDCNNLLYTLIVTAHTMYYEHFDKYHGLLPKGQWPASYMNTMHLVPRSFMHTPASCQALM